MNGQSRYAVVPLVTLIVVSGRTLSSSVICGEPAEMKYKGCNVILQKLFVLRNLSIVTTSGS